MEDETPFLFRSPFLPERGAEAVERNAACIERDLASIRTRGYDEFARGRVAEAGSDAGGGRGRDAAAEELGTAFDGSLRDYQTYMLERAREENVVVHLGTGMGKTLVGIFLIREFLSRRRGTDEDKNHILFLVPSVALAVQHTGRFTPAGGGASTFARRRNSPNVFLPPFPSQIRSGRIFPAWIQRNQYIKRRGKMTPATTITITMATILTSSLRPGSSPITTLFSARCEDQSHTPDSPPC